MVSLNIFTCADGKYEDFALLFLSSCLWSNPGATVEIGLENSKSFLETNAQPIETLAAEYGSGAFLIRDVAWQSPTNRRILPHSVRFVTEPVLQSDYVYISDIDIVTLRAIEKRHIDFMVRNKQPYSNWVRPGTKRLTGLHFCQRDWQYPLLLNDDLLNAPVSDEQLLYLLVERKLGFPPVETESYRPVHGIHVSPNRAPEASEKDGQRIPGWAIGPHGTVWLEFRKTKTFRVVEPFLSPRIREFLVHVDEVAGVEHAASAASERQARS